MTAPQTGLRAAPEAAGRRVHPDREGLPVWLVVGLCIATAVAVGCAGWSASSGRGGLEPGGAFLLGAVAAVLAVAGLPSMSIRFVARTMGIASALGLARLGLLGGPGTSGLTILALWIIAVVAVAVLSDQVGDSRHRPMTDPSELERPRPEPPATGRRVRRRRSRANASTTRDTDQLLSSFSRIIVLGVGLALLTGLGLPSVTDRVRNPSDAGDPARAPNPFDEARALVSSSTLDMTQRPRLSDRVVFMVDSPAATFWRGQTFDIWDGRYWARTDGGLEELGASGEVPPRPHDLAADGSDSITQRFEMVSPFADLLYGAATPVSIDAPVDVAARGDGALLAAYPLGSGASYTVTSRRILVSEETLRAADQAQIPEDLLAQYASPPVTTDRVRAAATRITADADTDYDRIQAIQQWMGDRTKYSLNAPLAPAGADVVDDFLFESRRGWCEQIASSLVVLARANGIPARLVTGFVPGEQDRITGEFVVRERDAHAWAEVWFDGAGWIPFDPTVNVPLAGEDMADRTWGEWLARNSMAVALVGAGTVLVMVVATIIGRRLLARRRRRREDRVAGPPTWARKLDARLELLGVRAGRERAPADTATTYAATVGARLGAPDIGDVGRTIDASLYATRPPTPEEQAAAEEILDRHESDKPLVPL